MAWELEIHIIDVGQGESSLIIARDPAGVPPNDYRSMLIDGGLSGLAETVHDYVAAHNYGHSVDRIVTSHYDVDHSAGITSLLIADNRHVQNRILAEAAGNAAFAAANSAANNALMNQISAAAAAVAAASYGAYDDEVGNDQRPAAVAAGQVGQALFVGGLGQWNVAKNGALAGENHANYTAGLHRSIIPTNATSKRRDTAIAAGIAAGAAGGTAAARAAAAYAAIHNELVNTTPDGSRFDTGGIYRDVAVIDPGDYHIACPTNYEEAIDGTFKSSANYDVTVPNTVRPRITPGMGDEILWNAGNNAMAAPAGAPSVHVVAVNRQVYREPGGLAPYVGDRQNRISLGLIVRFNNFHYFTGGDMPFEGEERMVACLLGQANVQDWADGTPNPVVGRGFSNPHMPGTYYPVPDHICCFKCSHHGSHESTTDYFVESMAARAAFLSAGEHNTYLHPRQSVIDSLHNEPTIGLFYMTNCHYQRNHVPGWDPNVNQLLAAGNKSRIAGDNDQNNLAAGRNRGDIVVRVNAAESTSVTHPPAPLGLGAVYHRFRVRYWDEDRPHGAGFRMVTHNH